MKFTLNRLKVGDIVEAAVVENVTHNEMIVSFNGDLIRVANKSQKPIREGQILKLKVTALKPLSFQLSENNKRNLNITI